MILMRTKQTLHLQLLDQVNVAPSSRSFTFPAEWGCLELVGLGLSVPLPRGGHRSASCFLFVGVRSFGFAWEGFQFRRPLPSPSFHPNPPASPERPRALRCSRTCRHEARQRGDKRRQEVHGPGRDHAHEGRQKEDKRRQGFHGPGRDHPREGRQRGDKQKQGLRGPGRDHAHEMRQREDKRRQEVHRPGRGHPHEGRQRETSGDKDSTDPAETT